MQRGGMDVLSSAQVRTLRRLAESRHTPPYVARRAEIVLDEHRARATGAERAAGVTRQTAGKWFRRFLAIGPSGLHDAPRQGRPPAQEGDLTQSVLIAPLFADSPGWTSRSLAADTQCTQSAVARVWKRTFDQGRTDLGDSLPPSGLRLDACFSSSDCSILMLRLDHATGSDVTPGTGFMRSPRRPALQTILAADALCSAAGHGGTGRPETDDAGADRFIATISTHFASDPPGYALCTSESVATALRAVYPTMSTTVVSRPRWQGLLHALGPRLSSGSADAVRMAQHRAMEWARTQDGPFLWVVEPSAHRVIAPRRRSSLPSPLPLATSEAVADAILATLHHDIVAGRLRGGDRVTETYLARSAHTSRGHVRDALRVLASRGLIDLEPHRGAVVPKPGVDDVLETYAARRALGALIVRRVAESPLPGHLPRLEAAHQDLLRTARTGDAWATGEQDLKFQDIMAASTGMKRVPAMFFSLTAQLRLFVAVFGLTYAYSIPHMCADNTALLRCIADHNGSEAVNLWNAKMSDAAKYMIGQLNPRRS